MTSGRGGGFTRRAFIGTGLGAAAGLATTGWGSAMPGSPDPGPWADPWDEIRASYVLPTNRIYLNAGGLGPVRRSVLDTYLQSIHTWQEASETGHSRIEAARPPMAAFLGCHADELCFTRNATEGNAIVASGLRLSSGDEVVLDAHAHPGGAIAWLNRQKQDGVRVRIFEPDADTPHDILEAMEAVVTPRTRVIAVSHVTAPTGIVLPVTEMAAFARERGIWFHVDGAQSMGMMPIDLHVMGCDSFASSGHKWLGAPHGTGVLYIRRDRLDDVVPTEIGAYSDASWALPSHLAYIPTARRHESGTRSAALVEATAAAAEAINEIGLGVVRNRGMELSNALRQRLRALPGISILTPDHPELYGSMLTFRHVSVPYDRLNAHLSRSGLRCRVVTERNLDAVRLSPHVYTLMEDVDEVVSAVAEAIG